MPLRPSEKSRRLAYPKEFLSIAIRDARAVSVGDLVWARRYSVTTGESPKPVVSIQQGSPVGKHKIYLDLNPETEEPEILGFEVEEIYFTLEEFLLATMSEI